MSDLAIMWVGIGLGGAFMSGLSAARVAAALIYPTRLELPRWMVWIQRDIEQSQLGRHRLGTVVAHGLIGLFFVSISVALVFYAPRGQTTPVEQRSGAVISLVLGGLWVLVVARHAMASIRNPMSASSEVSPLYRPRRGIDLDSLSKTETRIFIAIGLVGLPIALAINYGGPRLPLVVEAAVAVAPVGLMLSIALGVWRR